MVEIDSKDAIFNENFSDYRERQGKLTTAPFIEADLRIEGEKNTSKHNGSSDDEDEQQHEISSDNATNETQQQGRQQRQTIPRQFLLRGTHSHNEIDVGKQQYSHLLLRLCFHDLPGELCFFYPNFV